MKNKEVLKPRAISHIIIVFSDGGEITLEKDVLMAAVASEKLLNIINGGFNFLELMEKTKKAVKHES